MKTIIITVPDRKDGKWKMRYKGFSKSLKTAPGFFHRVERILSARKLREKVSIAVKSYTPTGITTDNRSLSSIEPKYLLYCLSCFLESYLPNKIVTQYQP